MSINFDLGPPPIWSDLFSAAPLDFYQQHPKQFRVEFGPVYYRGRLDGTARVLIIGQDPSTDEILAQRTLVGNAGQRVQGLLRKLGLHRSYLMLNTFLFGIYGQFTKPIATLSASDPLLAYRNRLFDQVRNTNALAAVIAFGNGAGHAADHWPGAPALPVFRLLHPTAHTGVTDNWNSQLPALLAAIEPDPGAATDATPYTADFAAADSADIPRQDLPFGIPAWHGAGGATRSKRTNPLTICWSAPSQGA